MDKVRWKNPELEELAEQVGEFIRYWGFKKVHGKIWLHLFLSPEPLDAADLMARLKISKALVSMSLQDLIDYRVILPMGKGPKGTLVYQSNPAIMESILNVLRSRERKLLARIQASYKTVRKSSEKEIDTEKAKVLGQMLDSAESLLDGFLEFQQVDLGAWSNFASSAKD
jgi:DNA-binding transcriptional regulator GbsR (MarR family)